MVLQPRENRERGYFIPSLSMATNGREKELGRRLQKEKKRMKKKKKKRNEGKEKSKKRGKNRGKWNCAHPVTGPLSSEVFPDLVYCFF